MKTHAERARQRGFTLIEMAVTLALVGLIAMMALPLAEMSATRLKETELRQALRVIRSGIDAYKAAVDAGSLKRDPGESGYPPSLELLTEPLEIQAKRDLTGTQTPQRMVILRQLPRDPFNSDAELPASQTWKTRAYASRADDPQPGDDVFDIASRSDRIALDGTRYAKW
jgi:general secretion pathway protein G